MAERGIGDRIKGWLYNRTPEPVIGSKYMSDEELLHKAQTTKRAAEELSNPSFRQIGKPSVEPIKQLGSEVLEYPNGRGGSTEVALVTGRSSDGYHVRLAINDGHGREKPGSTWSQPFSERDKAEQFGVAEANKTHALAAAHIHAGMMAPSLPTHAEKQQQYWMNKAEESRQYAVNNPSAAFESGVHESRQRAFARQVIEAERAIQEANGKMNGNAPPEREVAVLLNEVRGHREKIQAINDLNSAGLVAPDKQSDAQVDKRKAFDAAWGKIEKAREISGSRELSEMYRQDRERER